jgi:hypothetical protein
MTFPRTREGLDEKSVRIHRHTSFGDVTPPLSAIWANALRGTAARANALGVDDAHDNGLEASIEARWHIQRAAPDRRAFPAGPESVRRVKACPVTWGGRQASPERQTQLGPRGQSDVR